MLVSRDTFRIDRTHRTHGFGQNARRTGVLERSSGAPYGHERLQIARSWRAVGSPVSFLLYEYLSVTNLADFSALGRAPVLFSRGG